MQDLIPVLDTILEFAPAPRCDVDAPLQFQAVTLGYDAFVGRQVIGRVNQGRMVGGDQVVRIPAEGNPESFRVTKLFGTRGIERVDLEEAKAGDLVILAGVDSIEVGDTVSAGDAVVVLEAMKMENNVAADIDGTITEVKVESGQSVSAGEVVIGISAD